MVTLALTSSMLLGFAAFGKDASNIVVAWPEYMFGDCLTSIIDQLLEDVNRHPEKRKRLARILALDIATEETLRLLLLEGLLRDVATKQGLREVEERLQKQIEGLRKDIWKLDERVDRINQR